jgi:hypothetical protein
MLHSYSAALVFTLTIVVGCERSARAPVHQTSEGQTADATSAYLPMPGFTSAQGTPPSVPAPTLAPAARVAPAPSTALEASINAAEQNAIQMLPPDTGHAFVVGDCLICHSAAMLEQQHKDTTAWNKTVTQMVAWGAPVSAGQKPVLLMYLVKHYGPSGTAP